MKKICLLLSLAMLMQSVAVSAKTRTKDDVDTFETFESYYGEYGDDFSADGWTFTGEGAYGSAEYDDDIPGRVLKLGIDGASDKTGAVIKRGFNKIIDEGKLHISYDFKSDSTDILEFELSGYDVRNASVNDAENPHDPYDYTNLYDGGTARTIRWRSDNPFGSTDGVKGNGKIVAYTSSGQEKDADKNASELYSSKTYKSGTWYKTDIFYDFDNKTYSVYVDGDVVVENAPITYDGIKGVRGELSPSVNADGISNNENYSYNGFENVFAYVDNIYMHEYVGEYDTVKMTADATNDGDNILVKVSFSEAMNRTATVDDVVVTNAATGKTVAGYWVEDSVEDFGLSTNNYFVLGIPNSADIAKYEVKIADDSDLCGAISGCDEISAAYVYAEGRTEESRYYYMNESFKDYKGGVPAGWFSDYASYVQGRWYKPKDIDSFSSASYTSTIGMDNSDALSIAVPADAKEEDANKNPRTLYYYFPSKTPATGVFNVEFDVKHTGGAWAMNYILMENIAETVKQLGGSSSANDRMNKQLLRINENETNLMLATDATTFVDSKVSIPANTWTNVKVRVDSANYTYYVSVNGGAETKVVYGGITGTANVGQKGMFVHGIMGIGIAKTTPGATVMMDNIRVYKDSSMVMDEDFDTYSDYVFRKRNGWNEAYSLASNAGVYSSANNYEKNNSIDKNFNFWSSGGWIDPDTTNLSKLSATNGYSALASYTRAFGLVPVATNNNVAGKNLAMNQADTESKDNYWTKQDASEQKRLLVIAPTFNTTKNASYTGYDQKRIQRYFDRAIEAGKPFAIEYENCMKNSRTAWGMSLLTEEEMATGSKDNMLFGFTAHYYKDGNDGAFSALVAPKVKDISLKTALENKNFNTFRTPENGQLAQKPKDWGHANAVGFTDFICATSNYNSPNKLRKTRIEVTPYYDGDVQKAKVKYIYEYTGVVGNAVIERDFMTNDIVGIAIDVMDVDETSGLGVSDLHTDGNIALLFDNIKVYELDGTGANIENTKAEGIKSIKAIDLAGEKHNVAGRVIENSTAIEVEFTAPVSDAIFDEGVVTVSRDDLVNEISYEGTLSNDRKTYTITFADGALKQGYKYRVRVSENLSFDDGNSSQLAIPFVAEFLCILDEEKGINVTELAVMKPVDVYSAPGVKAGMNNEILKKIKNAADVDENAMLYISGSNTANDAEDILVSSAVYTIADGEEIETLTSSKKTIPFGKMDINVPVVAGDDGENATFKAFVWDYETLKPKTNSIVINN